MVSGDDERGNGSTDRRSVLKAVGTAATATSAFAGVAAAGDPAPTSGTYSETETRCVSSDPCDEGDNCVAEWYVHCSEQYPDCGKLLAPTGDCCCV